MNSIAFEEMNTKKRVLYECMWGSEAFDFPVEKTPSGDSVSSDSYIFTKTSATNNDIRRNRSAKLLKIGNRLADVFGIKYRDLFKEKFTQSCGGSGQEWKRIGTLHSSSLCALLFFYNVTEENPYSIEIEGEEYVFTYSCFEYQNTVIEGRNPSNMDVVLIGTKKMSGKPIVLFLESKFSEYYERPNMKLKISAAYLENNYGNVLYEKDILKKMGLEKRIEDGSETFALCSKEVCYLEGIKQMISHYIGVRNLCNSPDSKDDAVARAVSAGANVLLGEILFTKGIGQLHLKSGEECFASYRKKYLILADILNERLGKDGIRDKFTVLGDLLSYTQFQNKKFIREQQVKRFYFELGK